MRLMECVWLRIMDIDFAQKRIHIRGKGDKRRCTILAPLVIPEWQVHGERVK
ncbi:hypothetical protein GF1_13500 [Desulfolithobacter dissulfuricans]|uniref:Tyr recombinase domain-containing protein n=1 Tax=Desulfolithobacter dissulfuricans TaxID=2795293 RepID=A0A915XHR6_9BACT|nr:hypothetical protein GF1_13500 [Desulfolithobacter dissulfuricans]